jgi:hypothetical protein
MREWTTKPQKYFVPGLGREIKVEPVNTRHFVAHYPTGLERVTKSEMEAGEWEHRGKWDVETGQAGASD